MRDSRLNGGAHHRVGLLNLRLQAGAHCCAVVLVETGEGMLGQERLPLPSSLLAQSHLRMESRGGLSAGAPTSIRL